MALLRFYADDDYWADHGILMVRDSYHESLVIDLPEGLGLLVEQAVDAQPGGTIAQAGVGWLQARTSTGQSGHLVRLEAHDDAPPDDDGGWDDVVETPYHGGSGAVMLSWLTGDEADEDMLRLGPAGLYRVRVSCRRGTGEAAGDTWRLQFWPEPAMAEPPRWLARSGPAVEPEGSGWEEVLDHNVCLVLWGAQRAARENADGASAGQIAAAYAQYREDATAGGGPDEPLWPPAPPVPLPTGHADRDAAEAQIHREVLAVRARQQRELGEIAAQLGLPRPTTVAGVIPLLVRAGLLTAHHTSAGRRYRAAAEPPRVRDVLTLPAGRVGELDRQEGFDRYAAFAADLVAVALWAPADWVVTIQDLAERLLATPGEVRGALQYAVGEKLLDVQGDVDAMTAAAAPLRLTVLPRREDEPSHGGGPLMISMPIRADGPGAAPPALGAPPRAGIVTPAGDLVVWREGRPVALARVPGNEVNRAIETAYGIALLSYGQDAVLVRPDGQVDVLADQIDVRAALSEDGRHLALCESHYGRRPWQRLHLIDLADGSRQTLDRPGSGVTIVAAHGGAVYFTPDQGGASRRWIPGAEPEPLTDELRAIDPLTGTRLAEDGARGPLVISPDGQRRNVPVTPMAELAPGGRQLYDFRYEPPAVTIFDIAAGGADPRICWLPHGSDISTTVPGHPVWEDSSHLLFTVPSQTDPEEAAVRLDVRTGDLERVPLTGAPGDQPVFAVFVEPLLRR